ncbi:heavy-metal-associated domain-containing protein [Mucilaginibacter flavus]|uniref:heavy-metal-associated domain-containing protein n=1 Tax=Mucilaginibacter flavus TaxID=931504 RepID=UPI0025B480F9|nr:cation transporter [Mucilaginibacter flavus]MDN3581624.1 cation transporter [Mucilaginibacter flavus]
MKTLKFKTNIKCGGCIAAVTPSLNALKNVKHWEVDTNNPDKILTIDAESSLGEADIITALKDKGYTAVKL